MLRRRTLLSPWTLLLAIIVFILYNWVNSTYFKKHGYSDDHASSTKSGDDSILSKKLNMLKSKNEASIPLTSSTSSIKKTNRISEQHCYHIASDGFEGCYFFRMAAKLANKLEKIQNARNAKWLKKNIEGAVDAAAEAENDDEDDGHRDRMVIRVNTNSFVRGEEWNNRKQALHQMIPASKAHETSPFVYRGCTLPNPEGEDGNESSSSSTAKESPLFFIGGYDAFSAYVLKTYGIDNSENYDEYLDDFAKKSDSVSGNNIMGAVQRVPTAKQAIFNPPAELESDLQLYD